MEAFFWPELQPDGRYYVMAWHDGDDRPMAAGLPWYMRERLSRPKAISGPWLDQTSALDQCGEEADIVAPGAGRVTGQQHLVMTNRRVPEWVPGGPVERFCYRVCPVLHIAKSQ